MVRIQGSPFISYKTLLVVNDFVDFVMDELSTKPRASLADVLNPHVMQSTYRGGRQAFLLTAPAKIAGKCMPMRYDGPSTAIASPPAGLTLRASKKRGSATQSVTQQKTPDRSADTSQVPEGL